ncbi:MAG: dihydrolipoamide acetyltransferase family protein [Sphaerochaeta sp.]|jgi:pyruvate dehydrogenase E2 component (dihydrolipoamide acetyltransferase)|nr:2-oxo acid dehydrogenase subunit E2 [Spirochaetales bacterium]
MAEQVLMPKQGNTVESCIIVEWNVKVGDTVEVGTVLCSAETDKSTIDVESTAAGTILALLYEEGDDVPVMLPIAIVGEEGEQFEMPQTEGQVEEKASEAQPQTAVAVAPEPEVVRVAAQGASPRARNAAQSQGVRLDTLGASGPKGRIIERDVLAAVGEPLSPVAKAAALQGGSVIPARGSGIGGRVVGADLAASVSSETAPQAEFVDIPLKGIRKITAERMMQSISTTCQFTMTAWADARALKRLRAQFKAARSELGLGGITIGDLVLYATAKTLVEYPSHNAHFLGDKTRQFSSVDLGIATDTPRGLLVPVLRFSERMSLRELSDASKTLISKAREGKAQPDELSGSTFTVSNVGAFGIEGFTPVLNVPEVAILGVGTITVKPVEDEDGDIIFTDQISLSLTVDHQAVDGAEAARFLRTLSDNIAAIDLLLAL